MIPVAGSAYTYTYATMGRFMAWFIGWNLVLEYLAACSTVAVGWSGYFNDFMQLSRLSGARRPSPQAPIALVGVGQQLVYTHAYFNLPAVALLAVITGVLIVGVHLSANFNNVMVAIKLTHRRHRDRLRPAPCRPPITSRCTTIRLPLIPANTSGVFGQYRLDGRAARHRPHLLRLYRLRRRLRRLARGEESQARRAAWASSDRWRSAPCSTS